MRRYSHTANAVIAIVANVCFMAFVGVAFVAAFAPLA